MNVRGLPCLWAGLVLLAMQSVHAAGWSNVPGVVIDHQPASTGIYIGSPSITVLENGDYIAKHDEIGVAATATSQRGYGLEGWRQVGGLRFGYNDGKNA